MIVTRADIVRTARTWTGVRWRHQGRNRAGIDCVGLIAMVCRELCLSSYDTAAYSRDPTGADFLSHFEAGGGRRINPAFAADGDILAFHQRGYPCHVGFQTTLYARPHVIHAHAGHRKVIEELLTDEAPLVAVFTIPGVSD